MRSLTQNLLKLALPLGIIILLVGCKKEKPTLAKVRVLNTANAAVEDAEVILFPNPDPVLNPNMVPADTGYTDEDGFVIFDYTDDFNLGTAGFRILDIKVNSEDSLYGVGIIKIVEEEENRVDVVISPQ